MGRKNIGFEKISASANNFGLYDITRASSLGYFEVRIREIDEVLDEIQREIDYYDNKCHYCGCNEVD